MHPLLILFNAASLLMFSYMNFQVKQDVRRRVAEIEPPPPRIKDFVETENEVKLIIKIDAAGLYAINDEPLSREDLRARLKALAAENPGHRIHIDGDRAAPFQSVVNIIDECKFAGLLNIGVNALNP